MPGPVGKRDNERTRRNKTNEAGLTTKRGIARGVLRWEKPSEGWVDPVKKMYESFRDSGMYQFFEQSDVQMVWFACEGMQAWYDGGCRSANQFQFVSNLLGALGATEGERRRMRIELELENNETSAEDVAVAKITNLQSRMKAKAKVG